MLSILPCRFSDDSIGAADSASLLQLLLALHGPRPVLLLLRCNAKLFLSSWDRGSYSQEKLKNSTWTVICEFRQVKSNSFFFFYFKDKNSIKCHLENQQIKEQAMKHHSSVHSCPAQLKNNYRCSSKMRKSILNIRMFHRHLNDVEDLQLI